MYEYDIRVGYSMSDSKGRMTVPAIIDSFQDCSCFHSDDLGVGFSYLRPKDLVWVINYWELDILRFPLYGERLTVGTYPYELKSFFGYRNFYLKSDNEYIIKANSLWTLMDWTHMRPAKVTPEMTDAYESAEKLDMNYGSRKIALPSDEAVDITHAEPIEIGLQHLDSNGHVNNGQYIRLAFGTLTDIGNISRMRVEYRKQAHAGDIIHPVIYRSNNICTISLNSDDDTAYCVTELTYR